MRYANPAHPLEREAARHAVQQQVLNNPRPVPVDFNFGHIEGQNPRVEIEGRHANQNAPPPILNDNNLVPPPQQFRDHLSGDDDEDEENNENLEGLGRAEQQRMQVPNEQGGRRPYHTLARENAEALNVLLTREIPVLTHQLEQIMQLMNQLIRRQLDN